MKTVRIVLVGLLIGLSSIVSQAQDIYMKITPYAGGTQSPTDGSGLSGPRVTDNGKLIDLNTYTQVSSIQFDFEQTLSIGSQSTGAGAGRVTFNPFTITKVIDQTSGPLFTAMASGMAYQSIDFVFVRSANGAGEVIHKVTLKLAAVKTMATSSVACNADCPGIAESVSFEYGGYVVTTYIPKAGQGTIVRSSGWNRVKNVADNDLNTVIR